MALLATTRKQTDANQRKAADPDASVWVSASAGTGKTSVLINRLERLLLAGVPPERILCLTYTKAAAAEMQNRLHEDLQRWAILDDTALAQRLSDLAGDPPDRSLLARARQLFTQVLEAKGGLKIHTIHGFCERLLHRFPLEAGVAPDFETLDEAAAGELERRAVDRVLSQASRQPDSRLGQALASIVERAAELTFRELLGQLLRQSDRADGNEDADSATDRLRERLELEPTSGSENLEEQLASAIDEAGLKRALAGLGEGGASDQAKAKLFQQASRAPSQRLRITALAGAFLTKRHEPAARMATNRAEESDPGLRELLEGARDAFHGVWLEAQTHGLLEANRAIGAFAAAAREAYRQEKASRASLDYDDLIDRTAALLSRSESALWVLYKLDEGIDHILVDEAQDTSPQQWRVIGALASEFFAGEGARKAARTVFAVGDEKQSIYGFQGAEPKQFAAAGRGFEKQVTAAERRWRRVPLNLSFRSAPAVLAAVDAVFEASPASDGVTWSGERVQHFANRAKHYGLVEIWPSIAAEDREKVSAFDPLGDDHGAPDAPSQLAQRIAGTIRGWIKEKSVLASRNRPIEAGDILILVRKRHPFALPMIRALKDAGVPVAGADRMRLNEQLAVMDLMAFGAAMLNPQDDLSLACVLKSPLFGFDDEALFALAHGRSGSLWDALCANATEDPRFEAAAASLQDWLGRTDFLAPYEYYALLLEQDHGAVRTALIARNGPDAGDAIDEFLNAALDYDASHPPALQGFLHWMSRADVEIKRDLERGRNEVRVMTVHGAKGLEADIVFLPDTCSTPQSGGGARILKLGSERVWVPPGAGQVPQVAAAQSQARARETEEQHRLLYVAMTRARDRLYVCGYEDTRGKRDGCWYDLIFGALEGVMGRTGEGRDAVWRLESGEAGPGQFEASSEDVTEWLDRPDWAGRDAPPQQRGVVSITPSSVSQTDEKGGAHQLGEQPTASPIALASETRFQRGRLIHKLLQFLPELEVDKRDAAAQAYVEKNGAALDANERSRCAEETIELLNDESFALLFGPDSRAEVPIVAYLADDQAAGTIEISGQIDRLIVADDEILIAEYKTNRPPPQRAEDAAPAYLSQLAAYRAALSGAYPGKTIRCAIVWTAEPRLMPIPGELLDIHARAMFAGIERS